MRVLMCPPAYYRLPDLEKKRNPDNDWIDQTNKPSKDLAWRQWTAAKNLLTKIGLEVHVMVPDRHLQDLVFTANGGWTNNLSEIVVANFRHPTRRGEKPKFKESFLRLGFEVLELPEDIVFEGQGDMLTAGDIRFLGTGPRTDEAATGIIKDLLDLEETPTALRLAGNRFYHLDTCMMYLPLRNTLMFCAQAFDEPSLDKIEKMGRRHSINLKKISESLANNLACNSVYWKNYVLLNVPAGGEARKGRPAEDIPEEFMDMSEEGVPIENLNDKRAKHLEKINPEYRGLILFLILSGYSVIPVYTSEFKKSGGGIRCMTLFVP